MDSSGFGCGILSCSRRPCVCVLFSRFSPLCKRHTLTYAVVYTLTPLSPRHRRLYLCNSVTRTNIVRKRKNAIVRYIIYVVETACACALRLGGGVVRRRTALAAGEAAVGHDDDDDFVTKKYRFRRI